MAKKKIKLRKRILQAFGAVLFFSFMLTGVIFNLAIGLIPHDGDVYYYPPEVGFIGRSGLILFGLVGVMFVIAVFVTYFLSNSITRPIEKLGKFATGIGPGSFVQNNFKFKDKELEDLNIALNKTVKQLEVYDSNQRTFFQNASHELRTPLMSIKCYAEGINFGLMEPKQAAQTILQETDRLSELVADLLYISKIDNISTGHNMISADLVEIIQNCVTRHEALAAQRQINFVLNFGSGQIYGRCEPKLMSRAIDNLISNAIRYAATEIKIDCCKTNNDIIITVADDGGGIDDDILPHIFERFYKGTDGNTGIGLAIVKTIIEQHDGSITAQNNGGAVFVIVLP